MARHAAGPRGRLSRARPPAAGRSRLWRGRLRGARYACERPRRHAHDRGTRASGATSAQAESPDRSTGSRTPASSSEAQTQPTAAAFLSGSSHEGLARLRAAQVTHHAAVRELLLRPPRRTRPQAPERAVGKGHARICLKPYLAQIERAHRRCRARQTQGSCHRVPRSRIPRANRGRYRRWVGCPRDDRRGSSAPRR